jgi:hypothetical protein
MFRRQFPSRRVLLSLSLLIALATAALLLPSRFDAQTTSAKFTPNQELPLPLTAGNLPVQFIVRGLEPSTRVDSQGTIYVGTIRGVPGGVDMHRWNSSLDGKANSNGTLPFKYLGQPDGCGILAGGCDNIGVAEGGGDIDFAPNYGGAGETPNLPLSSLTLAPGITSTRSTDHGTTWAQPNPVAALIPGDDRQWMDTQGKSVVYMSYHDAATFQIDVQRSTDGGTTWTGLGGAIDAATLPAAGGLPPTNSANLLGGIAVDKSSCASKGNVYQVFVAPSSATENANGGKLHVVYMGVSKDAKNMAPSYTFTDYRVHAAGASTSLNNIFPSAAVDGFGNVYAVWSDNQSIWYAYSTTQGRTWSPSFRVNSGATVGKANVFPWVAADANGHVAITWFGSDRSGDSNNTAVMAPCSSTSTTCMRNWANWRVYMAESVNAHAATPTFNQFVASDHVVHRGTISTGGLGGSADRSMGDYFQVAIDPQHRANTAFSDDHKVSPLATAPNTGVDDPNATRLIRANFTREVKAPAGVSTTGTCATN